MSKLAYALAVASLTVCAHGAHASRIQASGVVEFSATDLFDGQGALSEIVDGDSFTLDLPIESYTEIADGRGDSPFEQKYRAVIATDEASFIAFALAASGAPVEYQFGKDTEIELLLTVTNDAESNVVEGARDEVIAELVWVSVPIDGSRGGDSTPVEYTLNFYATFGTDTWDDFDPTRAISFADAEVTGFVLTDRAGGIAFGNELTSFTTPAPGAFALAACSVVLARRRRA